MREHGQMSKKELDLLYSQIFFYTFRWLYTSIFKAKIFSNFHDLVISYLKHQKPNFFMPQKDQGQPEVIIWIISWW